MFVIMKIGILAYHAAINFGANLQVLSTYCYLKNNGHQPIVINWLPKDLEVFYKLRAPQEQIAVCHDFRQKYWTETSRCFTSSDIISVIEKEDIRAVIIGSDAVLQHHPLAERLRLSLRHVVSVSKYTSDRLFPNPFWGDFIQENNQFPLVLISGSSQDSRYHYTPFSTRKAMAMALSKYSYISVRDVWTQKMIANITHGDINPDVTPDPVFAFNQNVKSLVPSKNEIMERFHLSEKYILMSFRDGKTVSQEWLDAFFQIANDYGYQCVELPFSDRQGFGTYYNTIPLPLSPLDWYGLIKYSSGYVGHNMHPIVVCLHNSIPFYSFDNYGIIRFNGLLTADKSSKIKHILDQAGLENNRESCIMRNYTPTSPRDVFNSLLSTDRDLEKRFSDYYYDKYISMMDTVMRTISK